MDVFLRLKNLCSVIWLEGGGDVDLAVGSLVLLQEGDEKAWESGAGAVEGVAELVFSRRRPCSGV